MRRGRRPGKALPEDTSARDASGQNARAGGLTRRAVIGVAVAAPLSLPVIASLSAPVLAQAAAPGAAAEPLPTGEPVGPEAKALLTSMPGKAVMGTRLPPLVTELVDFNAPDWRRSARDMRDLLAGDPRLAYAVVMAPRLDVGSVEAARVALAVLTMEPLRFPPFYEALAQTEGAIDGVKALGVVRAAGMDHYKVFKASNQPEVTASLTRAVELSSALRLLDPPAYVIGNTLWAGYLDLPRKRALIAAARN
ncbi:hypothetical protein V5F59_10690 [Xanthobacter autotrophicus DSM 431]|uniref:hypothetical protein n=1 Tax=Xanthobacter nonsaccharivorans TaxID=3119912 RepID=UPI003726FF07